MSIVLGQFCGGSKHGCGNWLADKYSRPDCLIRGRQRSFLAEGRFAVEACGGTEFFLDAKKLIVFGDAVGTAGGAGLDLPGGGGHSKSAMKVSSVSPERWEMMEW